MQQGNNNECEYCNGTKEVNVDVLDTDSMQYMRGVGAEPCICTIKQQR